MKSKRMGPKTLQGSATAKRHAALILETLSGLRGPTEAAEALGTSLTRYYLLETRGLQGLIHALEPRPRGGVKSPEKELREQRAEIVRLTRELRRSEALVRAAQRSVGLPPAKPKTPKTRRTRRGAPRVKKVLKVLRPPREMGDDGVSRGVDHGSTESRPGSRGAGGGE